jgi:flagellar protein FlaG
MSISPITTNLVALPATVRATPAWQPVIERPVQPTQANTQSDPLVRSGSTAKTDQPASDKPESAEKIREAVEKLNEQLKPVGAGVRFNVDDESGRLVIQLMDVANDTVIRQIPSEEALKLSREPELKRSGLLVNTKA